MVGYIKGLFVVGILFALVGGALTIIHALEAEGNLHATDLVLDLFCEYYDKHGRFPSNWQELDDVTTTVFHNGWLWPAQKPDIQSRLSVRFDLVHSQRDVARWIAARGPSYGPSVSWLEQIEKRIASSKNANVEERRVYE
jgi:hypothetical protein